MRPVESLSSPTALISSFRIFMRSTICIVLKLDFPSLSLVITGDSRVSLPRGFFPVWAAIFYIFRDNFFKILVVGLARAVLDSEVGWFAC
jgi:hypothetical protein